MDFCVNIKEEGFYDKEILEMGGRIYHIPSKSENLREFKKQLTELIKNEKYEFVLRVTSNTMGFMDLKIAKKAGAKVCAARSSNSSDAEGVKRYVNNTVPGLYLLQVGSFNDTKNQLFTIEVLAQIKNKISTVRNFFICTIDRRG